MLTTSGKPGEVWRCESMNIQTPLMTLNLPITYLRIQPILLVGEYFVRPNLFTSAELWSPSLNKQVHSYVAKLFPSGIT